MSHRRDIEKFRALTKSLSTDIEHLVSDAQFSRRGGKILIAVDFSELYGYCMSASESFIREDVGILSQGEIVDAMHDSIMRYYMFDATEELWLLDPYLFEFHNFIRIASSDHFRDTFSAVSRALVKRDELTRNKQFIEMRELVSSIGSSHRESGAIRTRILELFDQLAPEIMALYTDPDGGFPVRKAQDLLKSNRLVIPTDLPVAVNAGDHDVETRWIDRLSMLRPGQETANFADAKAIAQLFSINQWLGKRDRPRRLTLLTRSTIMHKVMNQEATEGLWQEVGGGLLRHPRGVLALLDENAEIVRDQPDRQINTLRRWQATFQSLAVHRLEVRSLPGVGLTPREIFNRHSALVFSAWRRYCGLSAVVGAASTSFRKGDRELDAVRLLMSDTAVKELLAQRIRSMNFMLEKVNFVAKSMRSAEVGLAVKNTRVRRRSNTAGVPVREGALVQVFGGDGAPMPFRIAIESDKLVSVLQEEKGDAWRLFTRIASDDVSPPDGNWRSDEGFERDWYLLMGYVCGSIGAWRIARSACDWIEGSLEQDSLEVLLLKAKALRKSVGENDTNFDEFARVAAALRHKQPGSAVERLRLLTERVSYESRLVRLALSGDHRKRLHKHQAQVVAVLHEAWKTFGQSEPSPERCELFNNCSYNLVDFRKNAVEFDPPPGLGTMTNFSDAIFTEFVASARHVYGYDIHGWPDSFLDTFGWVCLQELEAGNHQILEHLGVTREAVEEAFSRIPNRLFVGEKDSTDFRFHAAHAQQFFAD